MEFGTDYEKLKVHAIFEPIRSLLEFYTLGVLFVGQPDFQKSLLEIHPDLAIFVDRYNKKVNLRREGLSIKSHGGAYWVSLGRMMAIALFDILQFSKYQNDLNKEEVFKFTKHIRNGAAHNNRFHFKEPLKNPIQWQDKVIYDSLKGTPVFPNFINPIELIFLMADISDIIRKKEKTKNIR